jgi:hypothetical protein
VTQSLRFRISSQADSAISGDKGTESYRQVVFDSIPMQAPGGCALEVRTFLSTYRKKGPKDFRSVGTGPGGNSWSAA